MANVVLPSRKVTVPAGWGTPLAPVTVAVMVTGSPKAGEEGAIFSTTELEFELLGKTTVVAEGEIAELKSRVPYTPVRPAYRAVKTWVPTESGGVVNVLELA